MTNPLQARRPRIALYGHDTQGLGHLRRNLVLARAFAADIPGGLGAEVLLLTGASEVGMFPRPEGVDAIVLPGVRKNKQGSYAPRHLRGRLSDVVSFRSSLLATALTSFDPDLLVVDKTPRGFKGELMATLPDLRAEGVRTVLGLRDVLDDEPTTRRQWKDDDSDTVIRDCYDEVWVYGDPQVHDLTGARGWPQISPRVPIISAISPPIAATPRTSRTDRIPRVGTMCSSWSGAVRTVRISPGSRR